MGDRRKTTGTSGARPGKLTKPHRNDIYGDVTGARGVAPAIPAATVVLLRDGKAGFDVLMLRKNSKISFGGMWVFPGGRIDADDFPEDRDLQAAARAAAAREAEEEAGVRPDTSDFVWFAHWSPPPTSPRRFATYFFAARTRSLESVSVDGGEILEHRWIPPKEALEKHALGEIDLAPPTWVSLYRLSRFQGSEEAIERLAGEKPRVYETHVAERVDGVRVAIWDGDSGYEDWNADADGDRHRLVMARGGFVFEHPPGWY